MRFDINCVADHEDPIEPLDRSRACSARYSNAPRGNRRSTLWNIFNANANRWIFAISHREERGRKDGNVATTFSE